MHTNQYYSECTWITFNSKRLLMVVHQQQQHQQRKSMKHSYTTDSNYFAICIRMHGIRGIFRHKKFRMQANSFPSITSIKVDSLFPNKNKKQIVFIDLWWDTTIYIVVWIFVTKLLLEFNIITNEIVCSKITCQWLLFSIETMFGS